MKEKHLYLSPACEEIMLGTQGVIATSIPDFRDGGDLFEE